MKKNRFLEEEEHKEEKHEEEEEKSEHFPWPAFAAAIIFCLQLVLEKTVGRNANASWLFAFGMGLHAFFAGLALGLEKNSSGYIALMLGILAHKFSESIAVGMKIFDQILPGKLKKQFEEPKGQPNSERNEMKSPVRERSPKKKLSSLQFDSPNQAQGIINDVELSVPNEQMSPSKQTSGKGIKGNDLKIDLDYEKKEINGNHESEFAKAMYPPKEEIKQVSKCDKIASLVILTVFCCMTPLGIAVGMAANTVNKWAESFLLGLSAGTFIYTGTIHVIPEEFENKKLLWWKTLAYFTGFGVICGVWFIEHKAFPHEGH